MVSLILAGAGVLCKLYSLLQSRQHQPFLCAWSDCADKEGSDLEVWSLEKPVTVLYLLLSRLSVCFACISIGSARIQSSIYHNLLCLEWQPSWGREKDNFIP